MYDSLILFVVLLLLTFIFLYMVRAIIFFIFIYEGNIEEENKGYVVFE